VDGRPVGTPEEKVYILLNKPRGYTSTRSDPHAKQTVLDLVRGVDEFLFPVGRLDVDTSGLIILTNDGELANLLTHPSHEIEKTYVAIVRGYLTARSLSRLEQGVELDDGLTAPARARLISWSRKDNTSTVEITIHEGKKRQVRRMLQALGHRVAKLTRVRLGTLDLGGLGEGEHRKLTSMEVARLMKLARREEQ
jgi:23S rRNA pseudouridine2605 synthase